MAEIRVHLRDADGGLPEVCMRCGEPSTVVKSRKMQWCPPWVGVLLFAGALPYVIAAAILTKRTRVQVPLCDGHKGHWLWRNVIIWVSFFGIGFVAMISLIALAATQNRIQEQIFPFVCVGNIFLLLIWLAIVIGCQATAIRPKEITDTHIVLNGVSPAFADEVDANLRRRARKRRDARAYDEDEDEDDEPPPPRRRRPPPPPDAIEE